MKAIELNTKTDKSGHLRFDYNLNVANSPVRVLVLMDEISLSVEDDDEKLWYGTLSANSTFDFLNDPEEDIYSINDGEPFQD